MITEIELQVIEREMQLKSAADIAFLLDLPVAQVKEAIQRLSEETGEISRQAEIESKEAARKAARAAKNREPREAKPRKSKQPKTFDRKVSKSSAEVQADQARRAREQRENARSFQTRKVNYTGKHMVQIAKGTWVYVDRLDQVKAEKEKYERNQKEKIQRQGKAAQEVHGRMEQMKYL